LAFGDEPRQELRIIKRFVKHCNCHLQGEHVMVGRFWKPYIGQAVGGELDLMVLIVGAEGGPAVLNRSREHIRLL
jgi:hypothetical protein